MPTRSNYLKRRGMPKKRVIFEYWEENSSKLGHTKQGSEWGVVDGECFACGNFLSVTHRAHIIPLIDGGSNNVDNLHILCASCHYESEGVLDYWKWLHYKRWNEWLYPREHIDVYLKRRGVDLKEEAKRYDAKPHASDEEIIAHTLEIMDKIGWKVYDPCLHEY